MSLSQKRYAALAAHVEAAPDACSRAIAGELLLTVGELSIAGSLGRGSAAHFATTIRLLAAAMEARLEETGYADHQGPR